MRHYTELADLRDEVLLCRVVRHAWEVRPFYDGDVRPELARLASSVKALRCTRCGHERFDIRTADGRHRHYYREPEDAQHIRPVPLQVLRAEMIRRGLWVTVIGQADGA
jgi:hypothetical protein